MNSGVLTLQAAGDSGDYLQEALRLAQCSTPVVRAHALKSAPRTITRRGVIWLGQTCNLRCQFCYFIDMVSSGSHPEHAFMGLEKAKKICRTLVDYYGNTSVDLQGGEPTIYPGIYQLVAYCREIGLAPTLITNALVLDNPETCLRFKDAGIGDFLVSVQGLGDVHDRLVGVSGAHHRQMTALRNLQEQGIPFRFNCVMSKLASSQLSDIALLARETGARAVNFITFNPFADQAGKRNAENVPRYGEVREPLQKALDILDGAGIGASVRYFPLCLLDDNYRGKVFNFQQLSYDQEEWDFASWGWTGLQPQRIKEGSLSPPLPLAVDRNMARHKGFFKKFAELSLLKPLLYRAHHLLSSLRALKAVDQEQLYREVARVHAQIHCSYRYGDKCGSCLVKSICDGFHLDYAALFGTDEARPVLIGEQAAHPLHYVSKEEKMPCTAYRQVVDKNSSSSGGQQCQ